MFRKLLVASALTAAFSAAAEDVVVIGSGGAGLSAAIMAKRSG